MRCPCVYDVDHLVSRFECEVGVDQCDWVGEEVEIIAVVADLLLLVRILLVSTAGRRVGPDHLPLTGLVDRVDDELRAPVRVETRQDHFTRPIP